MGDVVPLKPLNATLEFRDKGAAKQAWLIDRLLSVYARMMAYTNNTLNSPYESKELFEAAHEEITNLQACYAEELALSETMNEVCNAVHGERTKLVADLPDGKLSFIVVSNRRKRQAVALAVERRGSRLYCRDFEIFQRTDTGVAAVFDRYAAA